MATTTRRTAIVRSLALSCLPWAASQARAQAFPNRTVRIVVPNPAGGPTDFIARTLAQHMSETFGQPVIVENKPGASGMIAAELVAKAPPDGHAMLMTNQVIVNTPHLYAKVAIDPLRELAPVTEMLSSPLWLAVNAEQTSARSLKELVDQVKARPQGAYSYASVGNGSTGHLLGFRLNEVTGLELTHIPYKGAAPVVLALLAGEITLALVDYATLKPHLASGKLRVLAVSNMKRSRLTPEVPTFSELGYTGFESSSWVGLFTTARTPPDTMQKIHAEAIRVLRLPDVSAKLLDQGFDLGGSTQAQFAALVAGDFERWGGLIRRAKIKLD